MFLLIMKILKKKEMILRFQKQGEFLMKKIILILAAIVFTLNLNKITFAHSHIGETVPADGEVINEKLSEIVLNFDGKIELGSTIELFDSKDNKIELDEINIENSQLIGKLNTPLVNDDYKVNWSIISEDGHPLKGTYTFTINVEDEAVVQKETVETEEVQAIEEDTSQEESKTEGYSTIWIVLGIVAVILVFVAVLLFKRKK